METLVVLIKMLFLFLGVCLVVLIMLRKSEQAGLSSAFGGMGDTAFGVKGQKQLDKIITYAAIIFILAGILLNTPAMRKREAVVVPETKKEQPAPPAEQKP